MPSEDQIALENDAVLAELAQVCLASARDLQARQLAATDDEAAARLGQTLHRVARSVRQTAALRARLARERVKGAREDRQDEAARHTARVQTRKTQIKLAVERVIWDEYEAAEADDLLYELQDVLDIESVGDDFIDTPLDVQVERMKATLGLTAPAPCAVEAAAPSAPTPDEDEDDYWRSSA